MSAARWVGRVGMLAVALGIGTGVASGVNVALADRSESAADSSNAVAAGPRAHTSLNAHRSSASAPASRRSDPARPSARATAIVAGAPSKTAAATSVGRTPRRGAIAPAASSVTAGAQSAAAQTTAPSFGEILQYTFFNKAPTANPVQAPGQSATGVVTGDLHASGPTGAVLTYSLAQEPAGGKVDLGGDGTYTYSPTTNLAQTGGTDTFTVTIDDGSAYRLNGFAGAIQSILHLLAQAVRLSEPDTVTVTVPVSITATSFFDGFDGPAGSPPDPSKWTVNQGTGWDPGVENYLADNVFVDGQGHLVIQAVKTDTGYTSGRLQTKGLATFGYGTLTARIKLPGGQGLTPAFWLVGADENTNPWPGAGEIDVVELASDPTTTYSAIHGPISGVSDYLQAQLVNSGIDVSTDFHDYWVTRGENSITVGVDSTVLGTFTPESLPATAVWVFNKPFYAVMSVAVGSPWAGTPDGSTPFPATMLVDRVKWQPA